METDATTSSETSSPVSGSSDDESRSSDGELSHFLERGAIVPWTTKLLESLVVRHEITRRDSEVDETPDPQALELESLEAQNHIACAILNSFGWNGKLLKLPVKQKTMKSSRKVLIPNRVLGTTTSHVPRVILFQACSRRVA
jgi:hypothetical protein